MGGRQGVRADKQRFDEDDLARFFCGGNPKHIEGGKQGALFCGCGGIGAFGFA
jgi:hypothetical protein